LIDIAIQSLRDFLDRADQRLPFGPFAHRSLECANPKRKGGQLFAELIVHFARDAPPFVFLGENETAEKLAARPCGFCAPPRRQIEMGADNANDRAIGAAANWIASREDLDVVSVFVAQPKFPFVGLAPLSDA